MIRVALPFTDSSLLLNPRWAELSGPVQLALLLLLVGLPTVLVLWLYRYELRLVSRPAAVGLLALRLLVLYVLLFLVGFQPIIARETAEELPGRVLIAVDRSESTGVADPQRMPVEKLRLAQALKWAGDLCSDAQLADWIRQYGEGQAEPRWVADDEARNDPQRQQQLAEQRRQAHDRVCQRVDQWTRGQVSERVLASNGMDLLARIAANHKVELIGFAQAAWDVPPDQTDELFRPARGNPAVLGQSAAFTDLRAPLTQTLERSGPEQGRVLGVVLLSDGQHNWGTSPVAKAIELGERKLPVYPVALGARQPPPDVALVSVKAPPAVFKDVEAPVEARLKVSGLPAQEVIVELQQADASRGQPPMQERIRHDGSDRYYTVRFTPRLERVGTQALVVTARPVSGGEVRAENNSRPFRINVADDQARVLLVDGEARWEYHYLASALARDRTIRLTPVVFHQPRLGKLSEEELQRTGNPRVTLPAEPDAFASFDCIILGDVPPAQLSPPDRVRLEKYVADRGGTLVLVAGKRFLPLAFLEGDGNTDEPLRKLLPVENPRVVDQSNGFPLTFTHDGKLTPFLQLDAAADKSEAAWAEMPPHFWGVVGKAKPGATVLAYYDGEEPGLARTEPAARERERALVVRQNYGFGRVLFVGIDSTWRWRYKVGDLYHHRFWGQAVRWAASEKPLVTGNEFVRFGTREPVYQEGQEVELVVRVADEAGPLRQDLVAGARVLRLTEVGEEAVAVVPLERKPAQPRLFEGRLRDLPSGQYVVELAIPDLAEKLHGPPGPDGAPGKLRASFTVLPADGGEMVELATNWPLLEELAAKSGGRVFTPETAAELVDLLARQAVTREERVENRLWQWWVTLVLLLALLTVEWVARKWVGLP